MHVSKSSPLPFPARPDEEIQRIYHRLKQAGTLRPVTRGTRIPLKGHVALIESGRFEIVRGADKRHIGAGSGPAVTGLLGLYGSAPYHEVIMLESARCFAVPLSVAHDIIQSEALWYDVSAVLAHYLQRMLRRDMTTATSTAYSAICHRLHDYMKHRDTYVSTGTKIVPYLLSTTPYSRSQIYRIISELVKGGYIEVVKGRLTAIHHLPDEF